MEDLRLSHAREIDRLAEIEQLIDLVAKANIREVTVQADGRSLTIRKMAAPLPPPPAPVGNDGTALALSGEGPNGRASAPSAEEDARPPFAKETPPEPHWITAPMVGIFHPTDPPVVVGTRVEKGQVVGLIESMKLMNDIRAEEGGTVHETAVEAGMPVEYGQPLFALTG